MLGQIVIDFAGEPRVFNLARLGPRMEYEDLVGRGTQEVLHRLTTGAATFREVREAIRIGLIGGGMEPNRALVLVRRYVDERPRAEAVPLAQHILAAEIVGVPDEPVGKAPAAGDTNEAASSGPTAASPAPPSTEPPQRSDSLPVSPTP